MRKFINGFADFAGWFLLCVFICVGWWLLAVIQAWIRGDMAMIDKITEFAKAFYSCMLPLCGGGTFALLVVAFGKKV